MIERGPVKVWAPVVVTLLLMVIVPVVPVVARLVSGVAPTIPVKVTLPNLWQQPSFVHYPKYRKKVTRSSDVVIVASGGQENGAVKEDGAVRIKVPG